MQKRVEARTKDAVDILKVARGLVPSGAPNDVKFKDLKDEIDRLIAAAGHQDVSTALAAFNQLEKGDQEATKPLLDQLGKSRAAQEDAERAQQALDEFGKVLRTGGTD